MKTKSILATAITLGLLATGVHTNVAAANDYLLKYDIDQNYTVNAVDASIVLTEYANTSIGKSGSFNVTQSYIADYNYDKKIDAIDASYILSYYAQNSVKGETPPDELRIFYTVQLHLNNEITKTMQYLSYEECIEFINTDKALLLESENASFLSGDYMVFLYETNITKHKGSSQVIYTEKLWG